MLYRLLCLKIIILVGSSYYLLFEWPAECEALPPLLAMSFCLLSSMLAKLFELLPLFDLLVLPWFDLLSLPEWFFWVVAIFVIFMVL
jgi:hypothetical protein